MKNQRTALIYCLTALLAIFFLPKLSLTQPATEVYLFDLSFEKGKYSLKNPVNLSHNKGYDNQPSFLQDGTGVLFVQTHQDQTEVMLYDISQKQKKRLTHSEGSEYSPTPIPGKDRFSTIVLEKDGRQLLWSFSLKGKESKIVRPDLKIGYHAWINGNTLYSFVLGEPMTLQKSDIAEDKDELITSNIGRSLHKIPGKKLLSYVDKSSNAKWIIKALNPKTGKKRELGSTLNGAEDMAWTPKRIMLMGKDNLLYANNPRKGGKWIQIADLEDFGLDGITRLAVSPKGDKLAVVVNE